MVNYKKKQIKNKKYLDSLRARATRAELCFKGLLDDLNIYYIFQKGFYAGDCHCIVDFYLPKPLKICIEVDGGYHKNTEQKNKDQWRTRYLNNRGFKVIRFSNEEVLNNKDDVLKIINKWIDKNY